MYPPHLLALILSIASTTTAYSPPSNTSILFQNLDSSDSNTNNYNIPSIYESTLQARRILHLSNIATISTVFPLPHPQQQSQSQNPNQPQQSPLHPFENRPPSVAGAPIGQMEYFALCDPQPFNPTILAISLTTTIKNARAGSNVTLSLRYHLPADAPPSDDPWAYLPANLPRFALVGYVERLDDETVAKSGVRDCFLKTHPEAAIWEPGSDVHEAWWGRVVVREVYFFGGFGDRARIGWLPVEVWKGITQEEVERYRLVGERGYRRDQLAGRVDL